MWGLLMMCTAKGVVWPSLFKISGVSRKTDTVFSVKQSFLKFRVTGTSTASGISIANGASSFGHSRSNKCYGFTVGLWRVLGSQSAKESLFATSIRVLPNVQKQAGFGLPPNADLSAMWATPDMTDVDLIAELAACNILR